MTLARPNSARAWILAARPATLPAAIAPVAIGLACAHAAGHVAAGPAAGAAVGALLLQIAANFANDVFDYEKGADRATRLGPPRAVLSGLITPAAMRRGLVVALLAAFAVGIYLATVGGWPIVWLGLASIGAAVAYTGGPYPLGYHGLGDVAVLAFFGFAAVCGTAYVQLGGVPALAVAASIPVGALATCLLVVNNLRDRETDAVAGKRTLAVRFGARGARLEFALLLAASYAVPVGCAVVRGELLLAAPLLTAPWAGRLASAVWQRDGAALNACLPVTARLLLGHSLVWAAAIAAVG